MTKKELLIILWVMDFGKTSVTLYPNKDAVVGSDVDAGYTSRTILSWNETTVTWNNQSSVTTQDAISLSESDSANQNYEITIDEGIKGT